MDVVEYNIDEEDETWLFNNVDFGTNANARREDGDTTFEKDSSDSVAYIPLSSTETTCNKIKPTLPLETFERMIDLLEKATAFETIITLEQAERLILSKIPRLLLIFGTSHTTGPLHNQEQAKKQKHEVNVKTVITQVYNYWVNKRSKLRKPLLRKYWPITASNDTNPHMVFRPREKEKYKLRKKRQNDIDSFKKMKQLKIDFTKVRALLELVRQREQVNKMILDMQCDWFEQRLYDMIDTSALPRESDRISHDEIEDVLNVPKLFDAQSLDRGRNKKKRKRVSLPKPSGARTPPIGGGTAVDNILSTGNETSSQNHAGGLGVTVVPNKSRIIAADQENPPSFLHPLKSRETYTTSWENAVPYITTYVNSKPIETKRFRHRPRIGRGGRVMIDRIPYPNHPDDPIRYFYTIGEGTKMEVPEVKSINRMLDLLPEPLDTEIVRRKIEEIAAEALAEEEEDRGTRSRAPILPSSSVPNNSVVTDDGNDTEDIIVSLNDWLDTDDQIFGEEVIPPLGPV
jgi:enhancer of polycomb-like protein